MDDCANPIPTNRYGQILRKMVTPSSRPIAIRSPQVRPVVLSITCPRQSGLEDEWLNPPFSVESAKDPTRDDRDGEPAAT